MLRKCLCGLKHGCYSPAHTQLLCESEKTPFLWEDVVLNQSLWLDELDGAGCQACLPLHQIQDTRSKRASVVGAVLKWKLFWWDVLSHLFIGFPKTKASQSCFMIPRLARVLHQPPSFSRAHRTPGCRSLWLNPRGAQALSACSGITFLWKCQVGCMASFQHDYLLWPRPRKIAQRGRSSKERRCICMHPIVVVVFRVSLEKHSILCNQFLKCRYGAGRKRSVNQAEFSFLQEVLILSPLARSFTHQS